MFREDLADTTDLGVIGDIPDTSGGGLTYFAAAALTKEWRTVSASLRYSRDASTTAAAGGNVRDVVQASLLWRPADRWKVNFVAAYEQRDQANAGVAFDRRALVPATAIVVDPSQPFGFSAVSIGQSVGLLAREVTAERQHLRATRSR